MHKQLYILLLLLPPLTIVAGTQSTFYITNQTPSAQIGQQFQRGTIGSSYMTSGSVYQSSATTGVFTVQGAGMHANARRMTGRMLTSSGDDANNYGLTNPFSGVGLPQKPGDPNPDSIGDALCFLLLLVLGYGAIIYYRRKKIMQ